MNNFIEGIWLESRTIRSL